MKLKLIGNGSDIKIDGTGGQGTHIMDAMMLYSYAHARPQLISPSWVNKIGLGSIRRQSVHFRRYATAAVAAAHLQLGSILNGARIK